MTAAEATCMAQDELLMGGTYIWRSLSLVWLVAVFLFPSLSVIMCSSHICLSLRHHGWYRDHLFY